MLFSFHAGSSGGLATGCFRNIQPVGDGDRLDRSGRSVGLSFFSSILGTDLCADLGEHRSVEQSVTSAALEGRNARGAITPRLCVWAGGLSNAILTPVAFRAPSLARIMGRPASGVWEASDGLGCLCACG